MTLTVAEVRPCRSVGGVNVHIRLQIGVISMAVAELSDATCASLRNLHNLPPNSGSTSEIQHRCAGWKTAAGQDSAVGGVPPLGGFKAMHEIATRYLRRHPPGPTVTSEGMRLTSADLLF